MQFYSLNQFPVYTDDFFIRSLDVIGVKDAVVILNPMDVMIVTPVLIRSKKSLDEHIRYINDNNIKKAIVAAENIEFLTQCPSLEYLWIIPAITATDFSYAPLYKLPNLTWLQCETMYGLGTWDKTLGPIKIASIDYSRFPNLKHIGVKGAKGHLNVESADNVESLFFESGFPNAKNLSGVVSGKSLGELSICQAPIHSLDGIQVAHRLSRLSLSYNRKLEDISSLGDLAQSLRSLEIEMCSKLTDFAVLAKLTQLEYLTLRGSNTLQDLSFLQNMPHLKELYLTMNVADGDLSLCTQVPYVKIKNRQHYSHKDKDLPKQLV